MGFKRLTMVYRGVFILLTSLLLVSCIWDTAQDIPDRCPVLANAYGSYNVGGGNGIFQWSSDAEHILFEFASLRHPSRWYIVSLETGLVEPFDLHVNLPEVKDGRWSPVWSPIDNVVALHDGTNLYRLDYDTGEAAYLTQGYGKLLWSPDGKHIVFVKGQSWYVMNIDGTDERPITGRIEVRLKMWHPSEPKRLVSLSGARHNRPDNIGIIDIDSGHITQLTDTKDCEFHLRWSPDGRQITYISRDGNQDIFVMDVDGSNVVNLTNTAPQHERDFSWSPNGRQIVFTRYHALSIKEFNQEIYVMNADGSAQRALTDTPDEHESAPLWSPDGAQIAFWSTGQIGEGPDSRWWQLNVMRADGSARRTLATFAAEEDDLP